MVDPSNHGMPEIQRFLTAFWKDVDAGSPRPLAEYLAQFPGEDAAIAHEYAEVLRALGSMRSTPESIGQYRIFRELGRGGQGAVYLAEDSKLGRKVALKVLSGMPALSPRAVQRFRREAEITAQIDHPGICTAYDFGNEDGRSWIAMRYVEGETLAAKIAAAQSPGGSLATSGYVSLARDAPASTGPPDVRPAASHSTSRTREEITWVVRAIEQAARALHAAHERGVIHRDIKPANIMITPDDTPVLLDFGLANVADQEGPSLTVPGDMIGTPQYMAPEQLTRAAIELDRRADIFSLGVTLYEALTLVRPFDCQTRQLIYQAILFKDPPDPHHVNPAISRDLSAVVATAIEKDPDRRYKTALDFADDLKRVLDRVPVLARRLGPLPRLVRWAQRNPVVAGSVMSAFMILVAALIVSLMFLKSTKEAFADKAAAVVGFERLSDLKRLDDLKAQADDLLPPIPSKVEAMRAWVKQAESLVSQLPTHEADLDQLRRHGTNSRPTIDQTQARWKYDYLTDLVGKIKAFDDPDPHHGLLADVRQRLGRAETIRKRSIGEFDGKWKAAIESIADPTRSPEYGGRLIVPQIGLVPLGRNPTTGLWEFAVLDSGTLPSTDGQDASFKFEVSAGIVLILLPGGTFKMGSPGDEKGRSEDEAVHEVTVPPFFIGKYEITQAQWASATGSNPAALNPKSVKGFTLAHPVETVNWDDCTKFARRLNLVLPWESQWEYACRAGTKTAYTWDDDASVLHDKANVADQSLRDFGGGKKPFAERAPWNDGFSYHAPVDALAANAFGMYGLHGNVSEWCEDWAPAERALVAGRIYRDGCWALPPTAARAASRHRVSPTEATASIGLRVARPLDLVAP